MSTARWQHLDRRRPDETRPTAPTPAEGPPAPSSPDAPGDAAPLSPLLQRARALYHLRQFIACAELLDAALAGEPALPGARRLLGLALGQLGDGAGAERESRLALEEAPADTVLRDALVSAALDAGKLPEIPPESGELAGAAAWLGGQHHLREGRAVEAARSFAEAAHHFSRSSPPGELTERIAACYVGQAVSSLVAGDLDSAQQSYSRLAGLTTPAEPVLRLARQIYEIADAARGLPADERAAVLTPLAKLLLAARLRVRFYDGEGPVVMHWEFSP